MSQHACRISKDQWAFRYVWGAANKWGQLAFAQTGWAWSRDGVDCYIWVSVFQELTLLHALSPFFCSYDPSCCLGCWGCLGLWHGGASPSSRYRGLRTEVRGRSSIPCTLLIEQDFNMELLHKRDNTLKIYCSEISSEIHFKIIACCHRTDIKNHCMAV